MVEYFAHPLEQPRKGDLRLVRYFTKKKQLIMLKKGQRRIVTSYQ